jgi:predicted methyltransferase
MDSTPRPRSSSRDDRTPDRRHGYVPEDLVVALAAKAGFRLVGRSEINANPRDTKDYPAGVWTLPPVFALKDQHHEKYEAIGESDRMTLKFVKPS